MSNLLNSLKVTSNKTLTENGAIAYNTTESCIVDFFAQAGAMRSRSEQEIMDLFNKSFKEDKLMTVKLAYYFRDIRKGQGERRLFRVILKYLAFHYPDIVKKNIEHIPFFGRWDDLFELFGTPCEDEMTMLIRKQFSNDKFSEHPSLLGKWLKSNNASSKETKEIAYKLEKVLDLTPRQYRKALSELRKKINIVETLITNKAYAEIDYSTVPSQANMKYMKAFWKNDESRYQEFIGQVKKGEKKINAKVLYPYEIVQKVIVDCYGYRYSRDINHQMDSSLDAMWTNLPDYVGEDYSNTLAVIDGSGSMYSASRLPISSAVALGIYFAEKNKGMFHNHFITFSNTPKLIEIKGNNITEKVNNVIKYDEIANTNVERVFSLILDKVIANKLSQDDIPQRVVIISDMEFDSAVNGWRFDARVNTDALFIKIKKDWESKGFTMPRLTFWNVDARKESFPMTIDERGIQFVSGHSPSIFTSILKNNFVTPLDLVKDVIENERYSIIEI